MTDAVAHPAPSPAPVARPEAAPAPRALDLGHDFVACAPAMVEAIRLAHLYAPEEDPVVLVGETGAGKSSLARRIHKWSGRGGELAEKSAGELAPTLGFDDMYGHEKGAFTGAEKRRLGLFGEAGVGTVLLDDFHLARRGAQAMLLRVLDTRKYRLLGTDRGTLFLARLVVGCGVDLDELVRRGRLLPDVRYRLYGFEIYVPPLRERVADIALLAARFLEALAAQRSRGPKRLAPEVVAAFELAPWPGNVRQLERALRLAYVHAQDDEVILYEHLPPGLRISFRFERTADLATKRQLVRWALWRTGGNVSAAAELIGAHRNTVRAIGGEMERESERDRLDGRSPFAAPSDSVA